MEYSRDISLLQTINNSITVPRLYLDNFYKVGDFSKRSALTKVITQKYNQVAHLNTTLNPVSNTENLSFTQSCH